MLDSLQAIQKVKKGDKEVLRTHKWLQYLYITKEKNVNLEQVDSLAEMDSHPVLSYIERALVILANSTLVNEAEKQVIEEVLIWSDVAKCGSPSKRREWKNRGFQLGIHNIGSAQIYAEEKMKLSINERDLEKEELVFTLIYTHGLIGQFIRGEVRYCQLEPLISYIYKYNKVVSTEFYNLLYVLNHCIIEAVSQHIWWDVQQEVKDVIRSVIEGNRENELVLKERVKRLRNSAINSGENFDELYDQVFSNQKLQALFQLFFNRTDMWYVESALHDFSFEEFLKIFLVIYQKVNPLTVKQISFEPFMKDIYYDYKGKKTINLYKKRIIEAYLKEYSIEDLMVAKQSENAHVKLRTISLDTLNENICVTFDYSKAGAKLIEFCQEAEKSPLYERAIILLYDFFGFRKDGFDRLQNEKNYLEDMNNAENHKKSIADYAVGNKMLDIGAGGGVMLDILSDKHPHAKVIGIDLSINVIEALEKRKRRENKSWFVKQADALQLTDTFELNSMDTIIFSSILHEMYSYIPYNGKKFNQEVITHSLTSAFDVLKPGGRIIIRDGIMTEPKEELRQIEFKNLDGIEFFKRYVKDFKGRSITYKQLDVNTIQLPVNDAMEFLYTYTWGEEAYPHEVQEQFGYFTPSEYKETIQNVIGKKGEILWLNHYLQDGYEEHLLPYVKVTDTQKNIVRLPDSTCFIVIEKKGNSV
ncbi:class I SAM-dependent methyltransferase [Niallia sp. FSL W8-0635]|uniref:class I SAM-dependent methyltransferase n=1 Tax=Niallia sp. FSL W8-0635 TaxID=2975337 RepID=UPI0009C4B8B5|nr:methylase involved in ubiquinone/menaquinone biosynthesis [Mycobacteroides abscessus subsp. abscessus]HEO8419232.1 class I SAM-dependent methyltransferase [Yersinia enterocolitica]